MKLATPISTLFASEAQAREIIAASDCLECRDHSIEADWPRVELFHTDTQPIHHLEAADWEHLARIHQRHPDLKLLSMHLAACCDRPVLEHGRFQPGGRIYGRAELLCLAAENLARIRALFGPGVELAVENNNYYPTPAYDFVCDPDFISEIVCGNRLRFLFDVAHAHVTSINRGVTYETYRSGLPLDKLIQIHLCRFGRVTNGGAYDAHELPGAEEFAELQELAALNPVEYLTFEYYKDAAGLIACLHKASALKFASQPPVAADVRRLHSPLECGDSSPLLHRRDLSR